MNRLQIGIDIGGTNIKAGIVDEKNQILAKRSISFPEDKDYRNVVEVLEKLVYSMNTELKLSIKQIKSIGVAVPGSIDATGEIVVAAHNLDFYDVPLKQELQKKFSLTHIILGNDANAATLAELHAGALKGCKTGILLTLGTGVGGGMVLNGEIFNGGNGHGIELGHMIMLHMSGEVCTCGNRGCMETVCNALWIAKQGQKVFDQENESLICEYAHGKRELIDAKLVIDCARAGDQEARNIFDQYVEYLGTAIASITSVLDPEIIALGGGVGQAGEFLYEPLREIVKQRSYYKYPYKIVAAALGNDAGIIGAALLAENN